MEISSFEGGEVQIIATWGIEILQDFSGAVFTMYAVRDENSDPRDPSSFDKLQPIGLTLERLKTLQKELRALIETMERGKSKAWRPH